MSHVSVCFSWVWCQKGRNVVFLLTFVLFHHPGAQRCEGIRMSWILICVRVCVCFMFKDLTSLSERRKQGLSQLATMLKLYLHKEVPDLPQDTPSLSPSCRDALSLIAKVSSVLLYHINYWMLNFSLKNHQELTWNQTLTFKSTLKNELTHSTYLYIHYIADYIVKKAVDKGSR